MKPIIFLLPSFRKSLGLGRLWRIFLATAVLVLGLGKAVQASELPQDSSQLQKLEQKSGRILRDYLARQRTSDFQIQFRPIEFRSEWVDTAEKAFPVWLALRSVSNKPLMESPMFRAPAEAFLLSSIESPDGIRMNLNRTDPVNPAPLAWWASWSYPGNPWKNNPALLHRAFVMATVDLMMTEAAILTKEGFYLDRSDFLGGRLLWLAYVYGQAKNEVPPEVARAYETLLLRLFERMEGIGPEVRTGYLNAQSLVGIAYLAKATGSPEILRRAQAYASQVLGASEVGQFHPAGIFREADGIDLSGNEIAREYVAWATLLTDWPILKDALGKIVRFKSLLTLPQPDGKTSHGPNHFNAANLGDSASDHADSLQSDLGAAMTSQEAEYLIAEDHYANTPDCPLPSLAKMHEEIQQAIARLNAPSYLKSYQFEIWAHDTQGSWGADIPFAADYYRKDSYDRFRKLIEADSPTLKLPILREASFTRLLSDKADRVEDRDTFLLARRPSYYLIAFTGRLGVGDHLNWGGGGISAFWTPQSGSVLLGRSGDKDASRWENWQTWPVHAVSGRTTGGDVFSTARLQRPTLEVKCEEQDGIARATVEAPLHALIDNGRILQKGTQGELHGDNHYERVITAEEEGVRVITRLRSDGRDQVDELFETLPVFLRDARLQPNVEPTLIEVEVGGKWQPASTRYTDDVSCIRLSRLSGAVRIEFDRPQRVRLAPEVWSSSDKVEIRSIQIDLLGGDSTPIPFPSRELSYRLVNISGGTPIEQQHRR